MIERIETNHSQIHTGKAGDLPPMKRREGATLLVSAKHYPPLLTALKDFVGKIWNWFKETFLFCFYDAVEDRLVRLKNGLDQFKNSYFAYQKQFDTQSLKRIKELFGELDSELQKRIRQEIFLVLKDIFPKKNNVELNNEVGKVLDNPFKFIKSENKPESKAVIVVMGQAITQVSVKISASIGSTE